MKGIRGYRAAVGGRQKEEDSDVTNVQRSIPFAALYSRGLWRHGAGGTAMRDGWWLCTFGVGEGEGGLALPHQLTQSAEHHGYNRQIMPRIRDESK